VDAIKEITPEQLKQGYQANPYITLGGNRIDYKTFSYRVISKLLNGNYIVIDPNE
jgi:hypothetical protein